MYTYTQDGDRQHPSSLRSAAARRRTGMLTHSVISSAPSPDTESATPPPPFLVTPTAGIEVLQAATTVHATDPSRLPSQQLKSTSSDDEQEGDNDGDEHAPRWIHRSTPSGISWYRCPVCQYETNSRHDAHLHALKIVHEADTHGVIKGWLINVEEHRKLSKNYPK